MHLKSAERKSCFYTGNELLSLSVRVNILRGKNGFKSA